MAHQVVEFHPNSNYIASGSSDRSVRVWDVSTGSCVRVLTGHKDTVYALAFSPDGRFLVSSGADCGLLCWDMANGHLISAIARHTDTVYCLQFSRDGAVLASGVVTGRMAGVVAPHRHRLLSAVQ